MGLLRGIVSAEFVAHLAFEEASTWAFRVRSRGNALQLRLARSSLRLSSLHKALQALPSYRSLAFKEIHAAGRWGRASSGSDCLRTAALCMTLWLCLSACLLSLYFSVCICVYVCVCVSLSLSVYPGGGSSTAATKQLTQRLLGFLSKLNRRHLAILDVGCGWGEWLPSLLRQAVQQHQLPGLLHYQGVDIAKQPIARLQRSFGAVGMQFRFWAPQLRLVFLCVARYKHVHSQDVSLL